MKYNGLDVYDITLQENDIGIGATSLVTLPATQSQFLHFNEETPQFHFADEEKQEVVGAFMIPDKLIYRNINGNKFYVNFTQEVIRELTTKMIKSGTAGLFTVMHEHDVEDGGIDIQEIWIKESETDKSVDFGLEESVGTAFMKVKVNNEVIWNQIKKSGLNGFSVELDASIVEKNELLFKEQKEPKIEKMSIKDVFKNAIEVNGVQLHFNDELGKGSYLVTENEDGTPTVYTGEFNHENVVYKVTNGLVLEAEDVQLSTKEAIESLITEFGEVKESVESILTSKAAIAEKEAELELLKTQFELDKTAFATLKANGISKVSTNLSENVSANAVTGKEWLNKFN